MLNLLAHLCGCRCICVTVWRQISSARLKHTTNCAVRRVERKRIELEFSIGTESFGSKEGGRRKKKAKETEDERTRGPRESVDKGIIWQVRKTLDAVVTTRTTMPKVLNG